MTLKQIREDLQEIRYYYSHWTIVKEIDSKKRKAGTIIK